CGRNPPPGPPRNPSDRWRRPRRIRERALAGRLPLLLTTQCRAFAAFRRHHARGYRSQLGPCDRQRLFISRWPAGERRGLIALFSVVVTEVTRIERAEWSLGDQRRAGARVPRRRCPVVP